MPRSVAVLQARMSSSRLPAKSLLPISGYPLAILSAKRAANTGRDVVLATSQERSDDVLARAADSYGVACFRGSLANTLERFVGAINDYDDDDLVFRLTADNVIPDGRLLDRMEAYLRDQNLDYLGCTDERSGLPYGVSAELTKAKHLRAALANAESESDREHVTPWIRRRFGGVFTELADLKMSHHRATVDTFDDYIAIEGLFANLEDPVSTPFLDLVTRLDECGNAPIVSHPATKLVLGTAQLGMEYGIANRTGQPSSTDATAIVKTAIGNGVKFLDTARAYGESEAVVERALRGGWADRVHVISKLTPALDRGGESSPEEIAIATTASVWQSCSTLGKSSLDTLLLHRADHLTEWGGIVVETLTRLVEDGVIGSIGVSIQTPSELRAALAHPEISLIQLPYNVLDWRIDELTPSIQQARSERGLTVHTRSALLQGLLPSSDKALWASVGTEEPERFIGWLQQQADSTGCETIAQFCLRFCLSQEWIDGVVVGVETLDQLTENLVTTETVFAADALSEILESRPRLSAACLDPARWTRQ